MQASVCRVFQLLRWDSLMDSRIPGVLLDVLAAAAWRWRRMTCQTVLFPGPFLHKCRFLQFSGPALFHPVSWPIQGRDNFSTHKSTESFCRHSQVTVPEMSPRYPQMKSFSVAQLSNSMQPHGLYPASSSVVHKLPTIRGMGWASRDWPFSEWNCWLCFSFPFAQNSWNQMNEKA